MQWQWLLPLSLCMMRAGVRRAAGKQAELLNKLIETPGLTSMQVSEKLVEVLGHTPFQVLVGALIGVVAGLII